MPVLVGMSVVGEPIYRLDQETLAIGSGPNVAIRVEGPESAPPLAVIQKGTKGFEIFDLAKVGVRVADGAPLEAAALSNGQSVHVGPHEFLFVDLQADILPAGLQLLWGQPDGYAPPIQTRHQEESFHDVLVASLKRTPWFLISAALHGLLLFLVLLINDAEKPAKELPSLEASFDDEGLELDELDVEDEEFEEPEIPEVEEISDIPEVEPETETPESETPEVDSEAREDENEFENLVTGLASGGEMSGDVAGGGRGSLIQGTDANLKRRVGQLKASGLDIVFLIDATSSMDREIIAAKRRISDLITLLEGLDIRFRLGIVAFRDKDDEYITRQSPLSTLLFKSVAFLDDVHAEGGGDVPEALYEAVLAGTRMRWSRKAKKVMVLVGDAPPKEGTLGKLLTKIDEFVSEGGIFHTIYSESDPDDYHRAKPAFRQMAQRGGGSALELEDENQIVEDFTMLALKTRNRSSVRQVVASLQTGVRTRVMRRLIDRGDADFVMEQLNRDRVDPAIGLELSRANSRGSDRAFLAAYIQTLRNQKAPLKTRWMITVLLRRSLRLAIRERKFEISQRHDLELALQDAHEFDPEKTRSKQQRLLRAIGRRLFDAGMLKFTDLDRER